LASAAAAGVLASGGEREELGPFGDREKSSAAGPRVELGRRLKGGRGSRRCPPLDLDGLQLAVKGLDRIMPTYSFVVQVKVPLDVGDLRRVDRRALSVFTQMRESSRFIRGMFIGGVQLVVLGVIAEYIGDIHAAVKRRPLYVVSEFENFPDLPRLPPRGIVAERRLRQYEH
jgi:hypothetical protein